MRARYLFKISFRNIDFQIMITITFLLMISTSVTYAVKQPMNTSTEIRVFKSCVDAIAIIYGVKLEPLEVVKHNKYELHIYYFEKYWYMPNKTATLSIKDMTSGTILTHDPVAAPLALASKCRNDIHRIEIALEKLIKKLNEENITLSNKIESVYRELWKFKRHLYYCNKRGDLLIGVSKNDINRVLPLVEDFVNEVIKGIVSLYGNQLNIKRVVVCGLDENTVVNYEVYERIDKLLRDKYPNLGLRLVRVVYPYSNETVVLDLENPFTGRPLISIASKYYDNIVKGNKTIAKIIGLAIADVLNEADYPVETVDVQVWPVDKLVFRPDVTTMKPPFSSKSGGEGQSFTTILTDKANVNVAGEGKEVVRGLNTSFTTRIVEPSGGSTAIPAVAETGGNTNQSGIEAAAAPRAVSQSGTDNVEEAGGSGHVSSGVGVTIATVMFLLAAAVVGVIMLSRRRVS